MELKLEQWLKEYNHKIATAHNQFGARQTARQLGMGNQERRKRMGRKVIAQWKRKIRKYKLDMLNRSNAI